MILRLQSSYSWVDSQYGQLADSNAQYGAIESLNARISLSDEARQWDISVWGRNLENSYSETYSFTGFAGRTVYRQQPAS